MSTAVVRVGLLLALASAQLPGGQSMEELACVVGPRTETWASAKQRFRAIFMIQPAWLPVPKEALTATMQSAVADLNGHSALAPHLADECGLGKLSIQLLSMSAIEDPAALLQLFSSVEQLSAPVLTLLLDVPWVALAQAGWPIFGLLSQINVRKAQLQGALNDDVTDGMQEASAQQFQAELAAALNSQDGIDGMALQRAAAVYMGSPAKGSALALLTAMATQAAVAPDAQERVQLLEVLQQGFKQSIGSGAELDVALATKWPLWGLIHMALEMLAP
eukprot:CAMPEP_0115096284 /NCGR_PEP_ID=MMETSP0227-20121206/29622_1 /TAXON_ID=89957 /ORGANISM="Polarella glacialis, Strain CCMP 1383" /LENGTH=276 /DNA_ID=CAMNT_0002489969 /DNA_START=88 /DNA_END=918 /DNA_ORIENTATION=-